MHFGGINIMTTEKSHEFEIPVYFNAINPDTVQVELYANGKNGEGPTIHKMARGKKTRGSDNLYIFKATVAITRPSSDYTPRIIPNFPGLSVPLETDLILWQR
jgi:starch phosphorylase